MATNKRTLSRIGFYCGLALFLIITLFPFFVMLMTSFKSAKEAISLHPTLLPQQWTLEHYVDIFNPVIFPFVDYFRNSMVVSVVSSVVAVFLGILGAYALSRLRFKGRMTINASFYTVYMFSGILLVVPLFKIITALGIYDTEMALIITMVTQTLPTAVFMLKSYFDTIPDEIEEAAMMDGLNRLQIIFRITVPFMFSVAEIISIGSCSPRLRSVSTSSRPFILGIEMSQIIRSGRTSVILCRASMPSSASQVVAPSEASHPCKSERKTGSSSTIRICFPANGCVMISPLADDNSIVARYSHYRLSDFT